MRIEETETGLKAVDRSRRSVEVTLDDWTLTEGDGYLHGDAETGFSADARRHVSGADGLSTDPVAVTVIDTDGGDRQTLHRGDGARVGPAHLLVFHTPVLLHARPSTGCTVRVGDESTVTGCAEFTIGFESTGDWTEETIRAPRSVTGLAQLLSVIDVGMPDGSPDRTFPNLRDHPPAVEFVEEDHRTNVPEFESESGSHTSITVPSADPTRAKRCLVSLAALAYYVGADVRLDDRDETLLHHADGVTSLGSDPETVDQRASDLLRRTFVLDCYAREAGPYGTALDGSTLSDHGLSSSKLYESSLSERVARYVEVPGVDSDLPEWHLAVHLHPTFDRCRRLSRYLSRLSDVVLPSSASLDTAASRHQWANDQRVRGGESVVRDDVYVTPDDRAETMGWDAPATALGAFNCRGSGAVRPSDETDVTVEVAQGSADMADGSQYGGVDVSSRRVETADLARLIESDTDLLHYVGHRDERGLECRDGYLALSSVDHVGVRAACLNGCETEADAARLVDRGATAAVGSTRTVVDDRASGVGSMWSRLVSRGWSFGRSLEVSARPDPSGYVLFGDGSTTLCGVDSGLPPRAVFRDAGELSVDYRAPRSPGMEVSHALVDDPVLSLRTVSCDDDDRVGQFRENLESPLL